MWLWRVFGRASRLVRQGNRTPLALIALGALALAGCATTADPMVTGSLPPPAAPAAGQAIAFESIDGPPKPVFERLVAALAAEAEARELPVVSRAAPAAFRVRAYLATHVDKKKNQAALSWAWDVFDAERKLAFRLSGEEPMGAPGADVWAQCDDALLARVAAKGFAALASRLGPAPPRPSAPESGAIAVASAAERQLAAFAEPRR